jgi:hypothetical protein
MAIGFIVISIDYTKRNNEDLSYNVSFTNIEKLSSVKGSTIEPKGKVKINDNSNEISMQITMNSPHDELSYTATIENQGSVPVEILDIMESPDYSIPTFKNLIDPVTVTLSDVKGKIIPPHETLKLKIVFYYNSGNASTKTFDYKIGLITRSR